ncbi:MULTISPECIES: hypothetical protein [Idiomarina]|uniref:hypothetical protein n=1 Tax=Idiomarina TaxID=135575 RepID=UPI001E4F9FC4|nr:MULTISPECIES: hypothetical protein [Idiomarina]
MELAPVALFAYNRPDHLQQTIERLAQCKEAASSCIYIFCDGPKPQASGEQLEKIEQVRALAQSVAVTKHFAVVNVIQSERNKGLANSIIGGVSDVMKKHGKAIVVEDDLLVAPDFLTYMNACLEFYAPIANVGSISGFSPLQKLPSNYAHDVYIAPRNCSHGWATWRDRWDTIDWSNERLGQVWQSRALRAKLRQGGGDRVARVKRQLEGKIDSWSIRFGCWQILQQKNTIYPRYNRVQNIGMDGSGVHTKASDMINAEVVFEDSTFTLSVPTYCHAIVRTFANKYSGSLPKRIARYIKTEFLRI